MGWGEEESQLVYSLTRVGGELAVLTVVNIFISTNTNWLFPIYQTAFQLLSFFYFI